MYNLQSELDEILRAQTFSLLTYHIPPEHRDGIDIGKLAGEIGTNNMLSHYGDQPGFIAPPDGPANVYIERIEKIAARIRRIGLVAEDPKYQAASSGVALAIRFQAINSALVKFADRMEDFERRMWGIVVRWLNLGDKQIEVSWSKDFSIADINHEIEVAQNMQTLGAPESYRRAKLKQIASLDLQTSDPVTLDEIIAEIDNMAAEITEPADA